MSITAAPHGKWFARIEVKDESVDDGGWGEPEPVYLEVVAWDDEGHAMVVNVEGGCLRRASEMDGFNGLATALEKDSAGVDGADDEGQGGADDEGEGFA